MSLIYLATFLFSLTMGALIMPRIVSISQKKNLMDAPDDRKVHPIPVPRLGGISFLPLTMMSIFLFNILCMTILGAEVKAGDTSTFLRIQCCGMGAMLLFLVGVADDLVGVDYRVKFLAQTAAAALFPLSGLTFGSLFTAIGWIHVPFWVSAPFTVFLVVYITNAINLIDGLDGLASGICIIAFTLYTAIFLYRAESVVLGLGGVGFMDSAGLGLILGRYAKVRELGGRLTVADPTPEAEKILRLAGADKLVTIKKREAVK